MAQLEDHKIENNFYYSDALERIYKIMGESRTTRWFSTICEDQTETLEGNEVWKRLVLFLETEVKVQQKINVLQSQSSTKVARYDREINKVNSKVVGPTVYLLHNLYQLRESYNSFFL